MSFTKDELLGIVVMCRHEAAMIDSIAEMVPGVKVHHARLVTATIASKADEMAVAIDKAQKVEVVEKSEDKAE